MRVASTKLYYLSIGDGSLNWIAKLAMEEGGTAQLHRHVRYGVVLVGLVRALQILEVAVIQRLPFRRWTELYLPLWNCNGEKTFIHYIYLRLVIYWVFSFFLIISELMIYALN